MIRAIIIFLSLFAAVHLHAEDSIDPEKKAAIQELMMITGAEANRQQLTHTFTQQLITVLQANGMAVNEPTANIIRDEVDRVVAEQLENHDLLFANEPF